MIGAAIDIDSGNNPYLQVPEIRALDKMLAFVAEEEAKANPVVPPEKPLQIEVSWLKSVMKFQPADDVERARRYYNHTVKISEKTMKFLHDFLTQWKESKKLSKPPTDPTTKKAFAIVDELANAFGKDGVQKLTAVEIQGLISIPAEVFIALDSDKDIQWLHWGFEGAMKSERKFGIDIMHFDVTPKAREDLIGSGFP